MAPGATESPSLDEVTMRVLLVEDNPGDAVLVTASLRRHWTQFEVAHVLSIGEAVAHLDANVVDVVLLDLGLPDAHELSGLDRVSAAAPTVPIVVLTGVNDDELAMRALRAGAQDFVTKGTHRHELIARSVLYAVERRRVDHLRTRLAEAHRLAGVGELAASVAHAMNNPAAAVTTNVYWLGETLGNLRDLLEKARADPTAASELLTHPDVNAIIDESEDAIEETRQSLARLTGTVQELVDLAKVWPEDVDHVQINTVIHAAGNMARAERGLPAQIVKDLGDLPTIKADRSKLTQAVTAVLHFLARDGADSIIRVATRSAGPHLVVTADREDLSLNPEQVERASHPFAPERGQTPSLAVASEIVRRHAGELEVTSSEQFGTRVTLRIPQTTGLNVRRRRPRGKSLTRPVGLSLRLMLVDDDEPLLQSYRRLLEPSHEVATATSGSEALAMLGEDAAYDAILVDLNMAGIDGRELYSRIAVKHPGLEERIVFCTGNVEVPRLRGVANPILQKPTGRGALLAALLGVSGKGTQ